MFFPVIAIAQHREKNSFSLSGQQSQKTNCWWHLRASVLTPAHWPALLSMLQPSYSEEGRRGGGSSFPGWGCIIFSTQQTSRSDAVFWQCFSRGRGQCQHSSRRYVGLHGAPFNLVLSFFSILLFLFFIFHLFPISLLLQQCRCPQFFLEQWREGKFRVHLHTHESNEQSAQPRVL